MLKVAIAIGFALVLVGGWLGLSAVLAPILSILPVWGQWVVAIAAFVWVTMSDIEDAVGEWDARVAARKAEQTAAAEAAMAAHLEKHPRYVSVWSNDDSSS